MRTKMNVRRKNALLLVWLAIILGVFVAGYCMYWEQSMLVTEQSSNVQQCRDMLEEEASFMVHTENWMEKRAMEKLVKECNEAKKYQNTSYQYKMYNMEDNYYWITSDAIHDREFNKMASMYFCYLGDFYTGFQKQEVQCVFEYMNEEQKSRYEEIQFLSKIAKEDLDIEEEKITFGEVTFVIVTIKPKSDFVVGDDNMSPSTFRYNVKSLYT